jgi:hypothetical protein
MLRVAVLCFFALAVAATAENPIGTRVTFNNGVQETGKTCQDSEWKLVQSTVLNATLTRRQRLLGGGAASRHLGRCVGCGNFCFMIGCPPPRGRRLQNVSSAVCNSTATSVTRALDALQRTLSPSCQDLIRGRSVTCFSKVECGVDHVSLWNAGNDTLIQEYFPWTGGVVCSRHQLTFEAKTNFEQGQVTFNLRGADTSLSSGRVSSGNGTGSITGIPAPAPSGSRLGSLRPPSGLSQSGASPLNFTGDLLAAPYFMRGMQGSDILGMIIAPGNYTLTVAGDAVERAKTVIFTATDKC